jgi:hypothetical protein
LLADAIAALSMESDRLDATSAIIQANFEVFVAEQQSFGEWWFASSGLGEWLRGISGRRFAEPEEAAGRELDEESAGMRFEFGSFDGLIGSRRLPACGPVDWLQSGEREWID